MVGWADLGKEMEEEEERETEEEEREREEGVGEGEDWGGKVQLPRVIRKASWIQGC